MTDCIAGSEGSRPKRRPRDISDQEMVDAYRATGNVHKAGKLLGIKGGSVHARLRKIGGFKPNRNAWTAGEIEELRATYSRSEYRGEIGLHQLAEKLGRNHCNISRKARELGLTNPARRARFRKPANKHATIAEARASISRHARDRCARGEHPRGMLGKKHTEEAKARIAAASAAMNASQTPDQRLAINMKGLRTRVANGTYVHNRFGTTWKSGWREIGGMRKFYRSRWEANYARYLQWQKERGLIADWKHEPTTFWFDGVKRGSVSYLPDFLVTATDGATDYREVKGWMDARSKTKIRRMAKYHPHVKLIVIESKQYAALAKSVGHLVPGWEQ